MSIDYESLPFERPSKQIKTLDMGPVPKRIFDGMKQYEDASRGYALIGFDRRAPGATVDTYLIQHRPKDATVAQVYRIPVDPKSTNIERLTYFETGAGHTYESFQPIIGEDWRGRWRPGGAILSFDLDGSENFQLWRYWEDNQTETPFPKIDGELDNKPGIGRIERITHDNFKYANVRVSHSNRIMAYTSTKLNRRDTLVYVCPLIQANFGDINDSQPLNLTSKLVTPTAGQGTLRYGVESISLDDKKLLITLQRGNQYRSLMVVDISADAPCPELVSLPGSTEPIEVTAVTSASFSLDPNTPNLVYVVTNGYGDYRTAVIWDSQAKTVIHITTPALSGMKSLRPMSWDVLGMTVTQSCVYWRQNIDGWNIMFAMPLSGPSKGTVVEIKLNWEGGIITYSTNTRNNKPNELVIKLTSHLSQGYLVYLDLETSFEHVQRDDQGNAFVTVDMQPFRQAAAEVPQFRTQPAQVRRYQSFDGVEVPFMYYHPTDGKSVVPVVISIHGGPEAQSASQSRIPIHWYLVNELGCAVLYPNVRGSIGYGKHYASLDDVEKREDSVKDIGALLDYIDREMKNELDSKQVAVMGGSYGGYMVFACLTHFSDKLTCGVANFGISHWPTFLRNTAPNRRDHRRLEYGDERVPEVLEMLERISPLNNAEKIRIPLSIAHGETDSRVTVTEAVRMWDIVKKNGIHVELMVCEKEGHGFKQKHVIEFVNAAKIHFLERFLFGRE